MNVRGGKSLTKLHLFNFLNEGKMALVKSMAGDYDEKVIQARIDSLVSENPVLMLSFTTCPFCVKAKEILGSSKYTIVELDVDPDGKAIRAELGNKIGRTSVPAIWIDGEYMGGCNDGGVIYSGLSGLQRDGTLKSRLEAVGAL